MSDVFRQLTEADRTDPAWREWLRRMGIQVEHLVWDGQGWIERRDNRVLYLTLDESGREPFFRQTTLYLDAPAPEFPV